MIKKQQTIDSYNRNAPAFANKFNNLGARINDIKEKFSYVQKQNPKVVEIGCANGRDAKEIMKYTDDYLGIDASEELIKIARQDIHDGKFEIADVENYEFPKGIDVFIAFASLIHSDIDNLQEILNRASRSMNKGGVAYLSMKYGKYHEQTLETEFGTRTYYFYTFEDIEKMVGENFEFVKKEIINYQNQKWIEIIMIKR